jgi:hypothetical protein
MSSPRLKILFIAPYSFGISRSIISLLEQNDCEVFDFDDRLDLGFFKKFLLRYLRPLFFLLFGFEIREWIKRLPCDFDRIVIINGEAFNLADLKAIFSKGRWVSFYTWDSVLNKPYLKHYFHKLKGNIDFLGSFDPKDCKNFEIDLVHLFATRIDDSFDHLKEYDYSFIGSFHSDRLQCLSLFLNSNRVVSSNCYFRLFCPNVLVYLFYLASNLNRPLLFFRFVRIGSLGHQEFLRITLGSRKVLDFVHPQQSGFTHRGVFCLFNRLCLVTNNSYPIQGLAPKILDADFFVYYPADPSLTQMFSIEFFVNKVFCLTSSETL